MFRALPSTILELSYYYLILTLLLLLQTAYLSKPVLANEHHSLYFHQYSTVIESRYLNETYKKEYDHTARDDLFHPSHTTNTPSEIAIIEWRQKSQNTLTLCLKPDHSKTLSTRLHLNKGNAETTRINSQPGFTVYKLHFKSDQGQGELVISGGTLLKECTVTATSTHSTAAEIDLSLSLYSKKKTQRKKASKKRTFKINAPLPGGSQAAQSPQEMIQNAPSGLSLPFDPKSFKPGSPKVFYHDILITLSNSLLQPDIRDWESENNVAIEVHHGPWRWLLNLSGWEWRFIVTTGLSQNANALLQLARTQASNRQQRSEILSSLLQAQESGSIAEQTLWQNELEGIAPESLSIYSWAEAQFLDRIFSQTGALLPRLSQYQNNPEEYIQKLMRLLSILSSQRSLEQSLRLLSDLPEALLSELDHLEEPTQDNFALETLSTQITNNLGHLWSFLLGIIDYNMDASNSLQPDPSPSILQATTGSGSTASSSQGTPVQTNVPSPSAAATTLPSDSFISSSEDDISSDPPPDEVVHSKSDALIRDLSYYVNQILKTDQHKGDDLSGVLYILNQMEMKEHFEALMQLLNFGKNPLSRPSFTRNLQQRGYFSKGFLLTFLWLTKRGDSKFEALLDQVEGARLIVKELQTPRTGGFYIIRQYLHHNQLETTDAKGIHKDLLDLLGHIATPFHIPDADPDLLEDGRFKLSIFYKLYKQAPASELTNWHKEQFKARSAPDFIQKVGDSYEFPLDSEFLLTEAADFFQIWVDAGISTLKRKGDKLILTPYSDEASLTPTQFVEILHEKLSEFSPTDLHAIIEASDASVVTELESATELIENIRALHQTRQQWLELFNQLLSASPGLCREHDLVLESWHYELAESPQGHYLTRQEGITLKSIGAGESCDTRHPIGQVKGLIANTVRLAHCILALLPEDFEETREIHDAAQNLIQATIAQPDLPYLWQHQDLALYEHLKDTPFYKDLRLSKPAMDLLVSLKLDHTKMIAAETLLHPDYLQQLLLNDIYQLSSPLAEEMSRSQLDEALRRPVNDIGKVKALLAEHLKDRRYSQNFIQKKLLGPDPISQGELMAGLELMGLSHLASLLFEPLDYKLIRQFLDNDRISQTEKEHKLFPIEKGHYRMQAYNNLKTIKTLSKTLEERKMTPFWLKRWARLSDGMPEGKQFEEVSVFTFLLSMNMHWIPPKYDLLIKRLETDAFPPDESVLEPTVVRCPGDDRCLLMPINVMELAPKYTLANVLISSCHCNSCGKSMFSFNYQTDERIVNEPVIRHCAAHKMDICEECRNQVCTTMGCDQPLNYMQTVRRNFKSRDPQKALRKHITCDHCKKKLATVTVTPNPEQPPTNTDGDHIQIHSGSEYILRCSGGHDICTSCLLASREQLPCLAPQYNYGRAIRRNMTCLVCCNPVAYRDVVHYVGCQGDTYYSHKRCIPKQISYCQPKLAVKPADQALIPRTEEPEKKVSETCVVCWDKKRTHAFLHGQDAHMAACEECARQVSEAGDKCPCCRQELTGEKIIRMHYP